MIPVIAIVGRPNVGKSTLFNCLTKTRDAIVADVPGVTRDRQFGDGRLGERPYIVVDTGGIQEGDTGIDLEMADQSRVAAEDSDLIFFVVDAKDGRLPADNEIMANLRSLNKPIILVVNKIDGHNPDVVLADFYSLGVDLLFPVATAHRRGVTQLIEETLATLPDLAEFDDEKRRDPERIKIAIAGRPNVGKSTLINRFMNEDRVVVYDQPGTTRDTIYVDFDRTRRAADAVTEKYTFIDTAGVRKRSRILNAVEKFSVVKTLQAIKDSHVVILVVDAREDISDQDLNLLGFVLEAGKSLVIAINKWDGLSSEDKSWLRKNIEHRLRFVPFAKIHYISALHGTAVGDLYEPVQKAFASAMKELSTPVLTKILEKAVFSHPPPLVKGRRIKLRYAHCGGHNPPVIVVHGSQADSLSANYLRYLEGVYRKALELEGTPVRVQCKSTENPFEGRYNKLTPRQEFKKKRLMKHVSGMKKKAKEKAK